ncbi:MAG TPA: hypothetical protein VFC93_07510 [Chloroflexota bacterium]|nr:hypothetical protein [Chloroflexota bacterium]
MRTSRPSTRRSTSPRIQPNVIPWYSVRLPGSQSGARSAMAAHIASQSHICSGVAPGGIRGMPAWWASAWRTVTLSLPCAPNSGQ